MSTSLTTIDIATAIQRYPKQQHHRHDRLEIAIVELETVPCGHTSDLPIYLCVVARESHIVTTGRIHILPKRRTGKRLAAKTRMRSIVASLMRDDYLTKPKVRHEQGRRFSMSRTRTTTILTNKSER